MLSQDLLGKSSIAIRAGMMGLIAVAAAPILPARLIAIWAALFVLTTICEQLARRMGEAADIAVFVVSFAFSTLCAVAAVALMLKGDVGARFFAVTLIGFSTLNMMLRFYSALSMLFTAMAPNVAVLVWASWKITLRALEQGDTLRALTPPATLCMCVMLFWPARKSLADAWGRLIEARRVALEGEAAAQRASQLQSDFLATMSHEIRTPLNGILGMAQAMRADGLTSEQENHLQVIRTSGDTLLAVFNDILDVSRIEAGQLKIQHEDFDLEHVTYRAVAAFEALASEKGLSFEFLIADNAVGAFRGDPVRLRQILQSLVSNAVKFTEVGRIGVSVSYRDGVLTLQVADSGLGIAEGTVDRMFEKFVQGDASATRQVGGSGLGLTLCRLLTQLMGGQISVTSVEGKGSVFTVALPIEFVSAGQLPEPLGAGGAPHVVDTVRILAAEDNPVNQIVLKTLLDQAGLTVEVVENGAMAVEAWRSKEWDIVLMDIQMPVMDGVTAAREIRAQEAMSKRERTPIIAVTANAMSHQLIEYESAGIDFVVSKPIEATKLFEAIEYVLEAKSSARPVSRQLT